MKKYIKYFLLTMKYSFMMSVSYKVDFFLGFLGTLLWNVASLLFLKFTLDNVGSIAGWDYYDMVLLQGVGQVWAYLYFAFSYQSLAHFSDFINDGSLDLYLLKPINSMFSSTLQKFDYTAIISMIQPLGMILYSTYNKSYNISFYSLVVFLFSIIISSIIVHLLEISLSSLSFWFPKTEIGRFFYGTSEVSTYPYEIFTNKNIRFLFFTIMPYALIINVPFRLLINKLTWQLFILQIIVMIFFFVLSKLMWTAGLKKYQGASS